MTQFSYSATDTQAAKDSGHIAIDGFQVPLKDSAQALLVSSPYPTVLSQTYDAVRQLCGSTLMSCQSLYGRGGRHALLFFFTVSPAPSVLNVLDGAALRWSLIKTASK